MRKALVTLLALTATFGATAPAFADDAQYWGAVGVAVNLGDGFQVQNEAILRGSDDRGLYQFQNTTLVGYAIDKHVTAFVGYVHSPNYDHGDFRSIERRVRTQIVFDKYKLGRVEATARLRLESRWRDGVDGNGWRVRPYVKLALPVANAGKTKLVTSHEAFINLNSTTFQHQEGWDRTRSFIGINTPLAKNLSIEAGYMLQHGWVRSGPDTNDHVLTMTLSAKF